MTENYALGYTDAEYERLIRQAARFAPLTERFFREAGIASGQRVLDLGSGAGDVAMLVAKLVGPSGEVVGVERDARSVARARARALEAGLHNVSFTQTDVRDLAGAEPFDAAVGRLILMYLPDPTGVLRLLSRLVRGGGVMAFQEPSWAPILALAANLPLWSACASLIVEAFQRSGVDPDLGPALHGAFQAAGLPAPTMHMDLLLGSELEFAGGIYGILRSLQPQIERFQLDLAALGDFESVPARLHAEATASKSVAPFLGIVGAWCRIPHNRQEKP